MKTPILFLVFNRPEETKIVFDRIKLVKPEFLYIAADGPRKNKDGEIDKCNQVKNLILENINWECKVKTLFRDENLGCRNAVSSAIDWFFKEVEEGIIIEDDVLPSISFFKFCEELLLKYRDDSRVGMISGINFGFGYKRNSDSYYFSRYSHIWGWASWRRAWEGYQVNMEDYKLFNEEDKLGDIFQNPVEYNFWKQIFNSVASQNFNTWDYQLVFHNFKNSRLNIIPNVNLITNIGFNQNATHTFTKNQYANQIAEEIFFPIQHPKFILLDEKSSESSRNSFLPKIKVEELLKKTNFLQKLINLFK